MILFRMIEFAFQVVSAVFIVLMLQISIGGQSLEDLLMSFIKNSKTTAPIRELAYSGASLLPGSAEAPKTQGKKNSKDVNSLLLNPLVKNVVTQLNAQLGEGLSVLGEGEEDPEEELSEEELQEEEAPPKKGSSP